MPTIQAAVMKSWSAIFSALIMSLLLSACGGGGSTSTPGAATDTTAPTVSSTSPASNALSVAIAATVSATFSEAMKDSSITTTTFTLVTTSGATPVSGTVVLSGSTATFTPAAALSYGTNYRATITTDAQDSAGNALAAASTWTFTTVAAPDTTPPTVLGNYPANNAPSVATNTSISVTFSEAMATTLASNAAIFTVSGVTGTVVLTGNTATFTPSTALTAGLNTATVTTGAQDLAGNALANIHTWSFTVGSTSDGTLPTVTGNTPANLGTTIAVDAAITATFSEAMTASTIASSFTLAVTGGVAVAGTATLSSNGLVATFPHAALTGQTNYTATVSTGAKDAAGNALAAASTWSFTTLDNIPPTVSAMTPASGASSIGVNTTVTATFSEAMTSSTLTTAGNFLLEKTSDLSGVVGTVTYSGTTATFTPSAALTGLISYTVKITGAQDTAGNALPTTTWSFTTAAAPTFNISGTVTGPYVEGMTITLSGGANDTAMTDANGAYSFATPRLAGTYTLTPSVVPGYTIAAQTFAITNLPAVKNFTATSTIASYSISGTVSYAGAKTGRTRVQVFNSTCTGCSAVAGITIASPGTGAYTIRGLQNGAYIVKAGMGYLANGAPNATNPSGVSSTVTVNSLNLTAVDIALTNPAAQTATTPTGLKAFPGNGSAFIGWDSVYDASGVEKVTAYKIYWGTTLATNGAPIVVGAQDDGLHIQSGLTDGSQVYYKIASCVSGDLLCTTGEGTASAVIGPVTIGATTGLNTVSGTVTFPGTPTGHLIVAVFNPAGPLVEFTRLPVTASPMAYSIAGVASGTLGSFVLLDANDNGVPDAGDFILTGDRDGSGITVSGNTTRNFTLTTASANATVGTRIFSDGSNSAGYSLDLTVGDGFKRVRDVTLVSGLNMALPLDMGNNGKFEAFPWLGATVPTVGSIYKFRVTFADNTTETLSASVTAVLGLTNMVQSQTVQATTPGTATVPLFIWTAPASPPASYTYSVSVSPIIYSRLWETNNSLPSTTLSVLYNADSSASSASLTPATSYHWQVTVKDANGNEASKQATYTTP